MKVTIKRNTGVMGGLANISLWIDEEEEKKLSNNEELTISTDKEQINLKVNQWFLGSKEVKVNGDEQIEIKINPICISLYVISIFIIFLSGMSQGGNQKLLFSTIGFVLILLTILYSLKSYFIIHFIDDKLGE